MEYSDTKFFNEYCKGYEYIPTVLPVQKRLIVIGDIHGDYQMAIKCFKIAKLIDDNLNWIGQDTTVIQMGDQLDNFRPCNVLTETSTKYKIPEDIMVFNFFEDMHQKAKVFGGRVISLLGNHEILNVMGEFMYVLKSDLSKFKNVPGYENFSSGEDARRSAFKQGNEYAKKMACGRISSIIIGSYLFVHAGVVPKFIKDVKLNNVSDLESINLIMRKWLLGLIDNNKLIQILTLSPSSMFWDRILGSLPPNLKMSDPRCEKNLSATLKILNINGIIIAHCPQMFINKMGINHTCDGNIWRVDVGTPYAFNNFDNDYLQSGKPSSLRQVQVLEILDDKIINVLK